MDQLQKFVTRVCDDTESVPLSSASSESKIGVLNVALFSILCTNSVKRYYTNIIVKYKQRRSMFTALHGMQTRYSDEKAVRPSVCPSNA